SARPQVAYFFGCDGGGSRLRSLARPVGSRRRRRPGAGGQIALAFRAEMASKRLLGPAHARRQPNRSYQRVRPHCKRNATTSGARLDTMSAVHLPEAKDLAAARQALAGRVERTPILSAETLDARAGAQLFFKAECLQRTGSFKVR